MERIIIRKDGGVIFKCPGCKLFHTLNEVGHNPPEARWTFNGDSEKPTLQPSILSGEGTDRKCHSFVTDGKIQFLTDSKHALSGQTVDLLDVSGYIEFIPHTML